MICDASPVDVSSVPIPFHIEMRRLYRGGERWQHELSFGVVGVEKPTTVIVSSELLSDPKIIENVDSGVLDLPDRLIDLLAIQSFRLMASAIIEQSGESGWWTIADIRKWVRRAFGPKDSDQVLIELARHVSAEYIVRNVCLVADDDAI